MPNKWLNQKGISVKPQRHKIANWSDYNASLKRRGDIEVWLSQDLLDAWYYEERIYEGYGSSKYYTDAAIITCHELRQVYKLPLKQAQGFIIHSLE
jgi:Transposase DDE domain